MNKFMVDLLGLTVKADTITASQICWRTGVVFLIAIVLLRISGHRTLPATVASKR